MSEPDNNYIRGKGDEKTKQYTAAFASPHKRFISYIIDSFIIYSVITLVSFFIVRNEIREEINKINGTNIVVGTEQDTKTIGNGTTADGITIVDIDSSPNNIIEKKYNVIESVVIKKLTKNKFFRYITFLIPLIYYILFLYYQQNTPGESFMNLTVVRNDGQKLEFNDIFNRVFLFMISKNLFIVPVAIILPIFATKNKITLYDFFSGSYVIEVSNA